MNRLVTLIALFVPILLVAQVNTKAVDEKFGFRDVKLGTPMASFDDLSFDSKEPGILNYTRNNENLKIGTIDLKKVVYTFSDSLLSTIVITVEGYSNKSALLKMLQNTYGHGKKPNEYIEDYLWIGKKSAIEYKEMAGDGAYVLIASIELLNKNEKKEQDQNIQAASTTF